jgi:hypothetical protein
MRREFHCIYRIRMPPSKNDNKFKSQFGMLVVWRGNIWRKAEREKHIILEFYKLKNNRKLLPFL